MSKPARLRILGSPLHPRPFSLQTPPHRFPWRDAVRRAPPFRNATSVTIQRVRFQRPKFFTWRRLIRTTAYTTPFVAWFFYNFEITTEPLDGEEEEEDEEDEEDFDPENVLFVPTGFPKKDPREYYKGSDPEWQAFAKLAQDPNRQLDTQKQLVTEIRNLARRHKGLAKALGRVDDNKGRVMLTITFPDGPPETYSISGVLFTDNEIVLAEKRWSKKDYLRHRNAVLPITAFWSIYESSKFLFLKEWRRAKETLGWSEGEKKEQDPFRALLEKQGSQGRTAEKNQEAPKIGPLPPVQSTNASKPSSPSPGAEVKSRSSSSPKLPPALDSSDPSAATPKRNPETFLLFMNTFMKNYNAATQAFDPPRGSVIVSGLIEVKGTKGIATLNVLAAYDVEKGRYVDVHAGVTTLKPRVQHPRG